MIRSRHSHVQWTMRFLALKPAGAPRGTCTNGSPSPVQKVSRALASVALVALVASGCGDSAKNNIDGSLTEGDAGIDRVDAPGVDSPSGDGSANPDTSLTEGDAGIDRVDAPGVDSTSGDGSEHDGPNEDAASNDAGERDGTLQDQLTSDTALDGDTAFDGDAALDGDACACSVIDTRRGITSVPCFCSTNPTLCTAYGEPIECPGGGPLARPVIVETYADCDYVNVRYDTGLSSHWRVYSTTTRELVGVLRADEEAPTIACGASRVFRLEAGVNPVSLGCTTAGRIQVCPADAGRWSFDAGSDR